MGQRGWHSRGYLPHLDGYEVSQHIVFRLHDSLPANATDSGDDILDLGHGCALLAQPHCAHIVANALMHHDNKRYALQAWCIMPNHVHVLMATTKTHELGPIIKSWKAFSAAKINAHKQRTGRLWAADYFDRFMRDEPHFQTTKRYIEMNPVGAGLCDRPEAWRFGSAGWSKTNN